MISRASAASAGATSSSPQALVAQSRRTSPYPGSVALRRNARTPWCSSTPASSAPAAASGTRCTTTGAPEPTGRSSVSTTRQRGQATIASP
jgi:hypothetical protein